MFKFDYGVKIDFYGMNRILTLIPLKKKNKILNSILQFFF